MENVDLEGIAYMWNEVFTWSKEQLKRFGKHYGKLRDLADPKFAKSARKPDLEDVCSRSFEYMDFLMKTVESYRTACTNLQSQLIENQQALIKVQKELSDCKSETPLHKSSNPFPIGRIRVRPKMNFQKFCIQVQKIQTDYKESKNIIHRRS